MYDLIKAMSNNNYERGSNYIKKGIRMLDVDEVTSLKAQGVAMQKQLAKMLVNTIQVPLQVCELCTGNHASQDCLVETRLTNLNK